MGHWVSFESESGDTVRVNRALVAAVEQLPDDGGFVFALANGVRIRAPKMTGAEFRTLMLADGEA